MTTLLGNELFEYLNHLNLEVGRLKSEYDEKDFRYEMHSQMQKILDAEKIFLQQIHKDKAMLSFSGNGLPTIESLKPDLEAMVKLGEENEEFNHIAKTYDSSEKFFATSANDEVFYREVSKNELDEIQRKREKVKNHFNVEETTEGKLRLNLRKDFYVDSIDEVSKKYSVARIKGRTEYQIAWGKLFSQSEQFYLKGHFDMVASDYSLVPSNLQSKINIKDLADKLQNIKKYDLTSRTSIIIKAVSDILSKKNPKQRFRLDHFNLVLEKEKISQKKFLWIKREAHNIQVEEILFGNTTGLFIYDSPFKDQIIQIINEDLGKVNHSLDIKHTIR